MYHFGIKSKGTLIDGKANEKKRKIHIRETKFISLHRDKTKNSVILLSIEANSLITAIWLLKREWYSSTQVLNVEAFKHTDNEQTQFLLLHAFFTRKTHFDDIFFSFSFFFRFFFLQIFSIILFFFWGFECVPIIFLFIVPLITLWKTAKHKQYVHWNGRWKNRNFYLLLSYNRSSVISFPCHRYAIFTTRPFFMFTVVGVKTTIYNTDYRATKIRQKTANQIPISFFYELSLVVFRI